MHLSECLSPMPIHLQRLSVSKIWPSVPLRSYSHGLTILIRCSYPSTFCKGLVISWPAIARLIATVEMVPQGTSCSALLLQTLQNYWKIRSALPYSCRPCSSTSSDWPQSPLSTGFVPSERKVRRCQKRQLKLSQTEIQRKWIWTLDSSEGPTAFSPVFSWSNNVGLSFSGLCFSSSR